MVWRERSPVSADACCQQRPRMPVGARGPPRHESEFGRGVPMAAAVGSVDAACGHWHPDSAAACRCQEAARPHPHPQQEESWPQQAVRWPRRERRCALQRRCTPWACQAQGARTSYRRRLQKEQQTKGRQLLWRRTFTFAGGPAMGYSRPMPCHALLLPNTGQKRTLAALGGLLAGVAWVDAGAARDGWARALSGLGSILMKGKERGVRVYNAE